MIKKIFLLALLILLLTVSSEADELLVPFSCYPKILQEKFTQAGLKLDLDGNDRTVDSWGYLKNEGAQYIIYTYRSVTQEQLTIVLKIAREVEIEQDNR